MPTKQMIIAPSILAADPLNLAEEMSSAEIAGADWHHVDVMDGHFVPNLTFGVHLVRQLKKVTKIPLDVHIMVSNPDLVALDYVDAGADILSFHIEAAVHPHRIVQSIKEQGCKAGVSLNPGTPLETLEPLLETIDLINIMSVNPGFGGQSFIAQSLKRIATINESLEKIGRRDSVLIEVDGGINSETASSVKSAGAQVLVTGSYFYGSKNRDSALQSLR